MCAAAVGGGEAEPARPGVGVPLRGHRAGQRRHPQHAVGARGHACREVVQELVHVGAGGRGARGLDRAQLVAEPAVGAAREPAGVLEQPAAGVGMRMQLGDALGVERRRRERRRRPARPCPSRRTRRPGRPRPRRASPPSRRRSRARPASSASSPAASRSHGATGPSTRVGRPHRRERRRIDPERGAGLLRPAAGGDVEQHRRRGVGRIDGDLARRPPGDERARQQEPARRGVLRRPGGRAATRSWRPTWPGSRLQPVSSRRRAGSSALGRVALGPGAPVHPDQRRPDRLAVGAGRHHSVELGAERDRAQRPAADRRGVPRRAAWATAPSHSRGSCSAQPGCGVGERVRHVARRGVGAVGGDRLCARPLRADVDSDDQIGAHRSSSPRRRGRAGRR